MSWYAYCLTEQQTQANGTRTRRPFLLEGIQGVNGAPVLSYPSGEFSVIVSEYDRAIENGKMEEKMIEMQRQGYAKFSHFGPEANLFEELEALFRDYANAGAGGSAGICTTRKKLALMG